MTGQGMEGPWLTGVVTGVWSGWPSSQLWLIDIQGECKASIGQIPPFSPARTSNPDFCVKYSFEMWVTDSKSIKAQYAKRTCLPQCGLFRGTIGVRVGWGEENRLLLGAGGQLSLPPLCSPSCPTHQSVCSHSARDVDWAYLSC